MDSIEQIYDLTEDILNYYIRKEIIAQGHVLTGEMNNSLTAIIIRRPNRVILEGSAVYYTLDVNDGIDRRNISYRMLPGLIAYFIKRGVDPKAAPLVARRTLLKWRQGGMPTAGSFDYSATGRRTGFIEAAFDNAKIDGFITASIDRTIERKFFEAVSESI